MSGLAADIASLLRADQPRQLTNKDGQCYTFDDRGAGYARGEGLGVLVLKRLDRALADGDKVHAIVVDSGCNHDGKTAGIFLPNPDAQEALARSVYTQAGLDPRETLYVEAHGTGTQAGMSFDRSCSLVNGDAKLITLQATVQKSHPLARCSVAKQGENQTFR